MFHSMARRSQLRIYTLDPATADEFVSRFHEVLVPLRNAHGFSLDGAWLAEDKTRFTWVTSHDCPEGWDVAEKTYYADPRRINIGWDPRDYISVMDLSMVAASSG
jgi:hypothetical protein